MNQTLDPDEFPEPEQLMFEGHKVRFATSKVKAAAVGGLMGERLKVDDRVHLVGTGRVVGVHHDRDPKIGALVRVHVIEVEDAFQGIRQPNDILVATAFEKWGGAGWDEDTRTLTVNMDDLTVDTETGEILFDKGDKG